MSVICPAKPSISVCGEHSESAVAELADLTFRLVAEMDTDADAGIWLQRSTDHIISLMKKLAPGLPGATIPTTSKPAHIAHPTADTSPIVAYTVARSRTVPSFANNTLSKGASSLMSSKVRKRSAASTTLVVTFRDIPKLEEFANQIVSLVQLESIVWRVTKHTARHVRRAARTGAVTEAYERAWDLAYASLSTTGTVPPDTPVSAPAQPAPVFTLKPLEITDTSSPTAPLLSLTTALRTISKGPNADDLTVDRSAFDPPDLVLTGQVNARYTIVTPDAE